MFKDEKRDRQIFDISDWIYARIDDGTLITKEQNHHNYNVIQGPISNFFVELLEEEHATLFSLTFGDFVWLDQDLSLRW